MPKKNNQKQPNLVSPAKPKRPRKRGTRQLEVVVTLEQSLFDLDAILQSYETGMSALVDRDKKEVARLRKTVAELTQAAKSNSKDTSRVATSARELMRLVRTLDRGRKLFGQHCLVMLVSRFDSFVAETLKATYEFRPQLLSKSQKTISCEDLFATKSLKEIRATVVEQMVEDLTRGSPKKALEFVDERLKLGIVEEFPWWPQYVELRERRNLYVHAGGRITRKYISVCREQKISRPELRLGQALEEQHADILGAYRVLFLLCFQIGQRFVRKQWPKLTPTADDALIDTGVSLLQQERWQLADEVFKFGLSLPEKYIGDDATRKVFLMNRVIAMMFGGARKQAMAMLAQEDWSACHPRFHLVRAVLERNYKHAVKIMAQISTEEVGEANYITWPAFREFRKQDVFREAFKKKFRKDFARAEAKWAMIQAMDAGA